MDYTTRQVRSQPGLTQEEALQSLQSHPYYRSGTKIASIRRRGDRWVADLLEPKTAEFPPAEEDADAAPDEAKAEKEEAVADEEKADEGPDGGDEGPAGLPSDGPPGAPGEEKKPGGGTETQILHVLTEILHALQGGPPSGGLGGPDDLGPGLDGPGGPPPHAGPGRPPGGGGMGGGMGGGRPMKPGEVPNKPGVTPVGAPAFASLQAKVASVAGRKRSFKITAPPGAQSVKQVVAAVNQVCVPYGYKVEQVRKVEGRLAALVVKSNDA